jgi:hypothetical protein
VLAFESRKQTEDAGPARLPKGPVRDVLNTMARTWGELDHLEQRNGLSFLREPDPGFVWAAYRWVRGAKLEDVLDSVPGLTPGDFVRSMKQLIDLLDQIAVASRGDTRDPDGPHPPAVRPGSTTPRAPDSGTAEPGTAGAALAAPGTGTGDAETGDAETDDAEAHGPGAAAPGDGRPSREPAPKQRDVASTARAAIDAMRRGVVAYTTLTD